MTRLFPVNRRTLVAACCIGAAVLPVAAEPAPGFESMPKIDAHAHVYADLPELDAMLARIDFRVVNICDGGNDPAMLVAKRGWVQGLHEAHPRQFDYCPTFDLTRRNEPGYAEEVIRYLDEAFSQGAVMVKIYKEVGLELKRPDGSWLMPDDPVFDPIYKHLARSGRPLLSHFAEPLAAWLPLDRASVHYSYYSRHPEWHFYTQSDIPAHETVIAARSRVLEKHPNLTMIGAHLGSLEHDVKILGAYLDRYPNFHVDIAARSADLSRQPTQEVRDFFIRYQDRVLYGSDIGVDLPESGAYSPEEAAKIAANAEGHYRRDWQYFSGVGGVEVKGMPVECLELPRDVLEKFYFKNAERLIPGLQRK
ncbi:MAG: amidohydrolase family protein [Candidatus Hydrogenedentes bacterium]|nr:amidohydrolase family protein [Candidatus Hydrogenedentota bacterium]